MAILENLTKPVSRKTQGAIILGLILMLSFLARLPFLNVPLDGDSGVFTAIGRLIARHGLLLYRDLFEIKPPGIYFLFAALFKVIDLDLFGVNVFTACWNTANVFLVYLLAKRLFNKKTALIAAFFYGLFSSSPVISGTFPLTENFMITFTVMGAFFVIKSIQENRNFYFLAGLFYGVGFLFKQIAAMEMFAAVILLFLASFRPGGKVEIKYFLRGLLFYSGGLILIFGISALYFFIKGAYNDFIFCALIYNFKYISVGYRSLSSYWLHFFNANFAIFRATALLWITSAIFMAETFKDIFTKRPAAGEKQAVLNRIFLLVWIIFAFIGVCLSGQFIVHYYIVLMPPFSIACAAALTRPWAARRNSFYNAVMYILTAVCVIYAIAVHYRYYFTYKPEEIAINVFGDSPFNEARQVPTSRYLWLSHYTVYYRPGAVDEVAHALAEHPPKYIVIDTHIGHWIHEPIFKPIKDFFDRNKYIPEKDFSVVRNGKFQYNFLVSRRIER